jgi:CSLREA domain-containing protein
MLAQAFRRTGLAALTALTLAPAALQARTFIVTRPVDKNDGACTRDCSLREAIVAANQNPGPDIILLAPAVYKLALAGADEDLGATGDLDITGDLTLIGSGPQRTILDGGGIDRVLDIHSPAVVSLNGLAVRNGRPPGHLAAGGGIRNSGELTLVATTVSGNSTAELGLGGGIESDGFEASLTLDHSTIAGNRADGGGGGIAVGFGFTVKDSTISGNRSVTDFGGGVYLFTEARASFNNATITANSAAQRGGGLFAESPDDPASPSLANSIVAGNSAPQNPDCLGVNVSSGHNLIGEGEGCPGFSAAHGDQTGTAADPLDPRLDRLANNGELTPTHALLPDSPALNAGSPAAPGSSTAGACELTDQRFALRGNTRCDIGAFERKSKR